ncbi:MAG: glutathione S-transferase family protein [Woeseiaceae bacterium]|nr:glutathione S-transferase family protein [Woeseiaceae bacterium]
MGLLVDGEWQDRWYDTKSTGGRFKRQDSKFRNWVTADGEAGATGDGGFAAEAGRYHLYVSLACPWAHRTLIYRKLKGLEDKIDVSVVHWLMGENGWTFADGDGVVPDPLHGADYLHQVYTAADDEYTGRVTVPVLWDKQRATIVSNESADIIRMFNSAFDKLDGVTDLDLYPDALQADIDALNERIYTTLNNGVYKAGFATSQGAYDEAVEPLFETLDWLDARVSGQRYLTGDTITEADWRLFTTLVRFDAAYVGHFKCNRHRLVDFPHLWPYTRDLYQQPGIADTVNLHHIRHHYYCSHPTVNPSGIVPVESGDRFRQAARARLTPAPALAWPVREG